MKKQMKALISLALVVVLFGALALTSFALPYNSNIIDSYFYDVNNDAAASPLAYNVVKVIGGQTMGVGLTFKPIDLCVAGEYLYILDNAGNRVVVLDSEFNLVTAISRLTDSETYKVPDIDAKNYTSEKKDGEYTVDSKLEKADKYSFNAPEGIYVDDEGKIYVADTGSRRVVVLNLEGEVSRVYQSIRVSVLGDYNFKPMKVLVDNTGFINVICYDVNKGIMRIDEDGSFDSFFAQPTVKDTGVDIIAQWADELAGLKDNEVKEAAFSYVSATRDSLGFIYVTAYESEDTAAVPLQKLNSAGTNVLSQKDNTKVQVFGDPLILGEELYPKMIDVAVNETADTYTLLDASNCRFFTYNSGGALLYVGGGNGPQYGRLRSASCIETWGDYVIVGDKDAAAITVYELTDYAKQLNNAMALYKRRQYDESAECWLAVSQYNSNMYLAFESLGNVALINGRDLDDNDPKKIQYMQSALSYFTSAVNQAGYSNAYAELRDVQMSKYFTLLFGTVIVVGVGLFVLTQVRKAMRKKEERRRRLGL